MRFLRRGRSASTLDLLVAGLGNPGREYERTRHNAGWMVLDEVARRHGGSWRSKFSGSLSEVRLGNLRLALLCVSPMYVVGAAFVVVSRRTYVADVAMVVAEARKHVGKHEIG